MDNIGLMSETVNFIQGSKRNYDSSTMQGGVYFSKDSKEIFLNGESYGNAVPTDEEDLTSTNAGFVYYAQLLKRKFFGMALFGLIWMALIQIHLQMKG